MSSKLKPTFTSSHDMLDWQYKMLLAEIQQLQLHAEDSSCPCSLRDMGEYCLAKHSLNVASLASETATMDDKNAEMLFDLAEDATEMHKKLREHVCGHGDDVDVVTWSRQWRKKLEPIYYACKVKAKLKDGDFAEVFEVPKAVVRYKRNYGSGKSVYFVEYEYNGERLITGTVERDGVKSQGWYFGKGLEGLKTANRIALMDDEDFDKAELDKTYFWKTVKARLHESLTAEDVAQLFAPPPTLTKEVDRLRSLASELSTVASAELAERQSYSLPAPFGWVGGKKQLKKKIVSLIPPHKTYVEPFAGAASVFWAKEPSAIEVLNDIDPDLMRFYRDISSTDKCNISRLAKKFDELKEKDGKLTPCEFLSEVVCSFGNKRKYYVGRGAWGTLSDSACYNNAPQFRHYLPEYDERLKSVKLHNKDWQEIVEQYDAPDTFFYLDPPYHSTTRSYKGGEDQLARLAEILPSLQGKWLLSYDNCADVRKAFASYNIMPVSSTYTINRNKQLNGRQVLIANYSIKHTGAKLAEDITPDKLVMFAERLILNPCAEAKSTLAKYGDDVKAGHDAAAEFWKGQAAAFSTMCIEKLFADKTKMAELQDRSKSTIEQIGNVKAEIEGLESSLEGNRASDLLRIVTRSGKMKGEVTRLTIRQFRDLLGYDPPQAVRDNGHVPWQYALDQLATERGFKSDEDLKEAIEQARDDTQKLEKLGRELSWLEGHVKSAPEGTPKCVGAIQQTEPCPAFPEESCKSEATSCENVRGTITRQPSYWVGSIDGKEQFTTRFAKDARRELKQVIAPLKEEASMEESRIPKAIDVYSNVIHRHYRDTKDMQDGTIRTLKPAKGVLVYIGCPLGAKWNAKTKRCSPKAEIVKSVVPRTDRYEQELQAFRRSHPSIKVKFHTAEGVEAREPELEEVKDAMKTAEVVE